MPLHRLHTGVALSAMISRSPVLGIHLQINNAVAHTTHTVALSAMISRWRTPTCTNDKIKSSYRLHTGVALSATISHRPVHSIHLQLNKVVAHTAHIVALSATIFYRPALNVHPGQIMWLHRLHTGVALSAMISRSPVLTTHVH
jgi:hypothetical protein